MSTPDTEATQVYATLVRGRVYFLKDMEFLNGNPVAITPAQRDWLEENAVDEVSVEGEGEYQLRQKFRFTAEAPVAALDGEEPAPPRARRRG